MRLRVRYENEFSRWRVQIGVLKTLNLKAGRGKIPTYFQNTKSGTRVQHEHELIRKSAHSGSRAKIKNLSRCAARARRSHGHVPSPNVLAIRENERGSLSHTYLMRFTSTVELRKIDKPGRTVPLVGDIGADRSVPNRERLNVRTECEAMNDTSTGRPRCR